MTITTEQHLALYKIAFGDLSVKELEWCGVVRGPGNGPMGSGPGGTPYAACPDCKGLREPNENFIPEAVGHRPHCAMDAMLRSIR